MNPITLITSRTVTEVEKFFSIALGRFLMSWLRIYDFRRVAEAGLPEAEKVLSSVAARLDEALRRSPAYDQLGLGKVPAVWTQRTIERAKTTVDAASLVFAHSVLDASALDCCRVTAMVAPEEWESDLGEKKVALVEVRGKSYQVLLQKRLEEHLQELEKESLLTKIDRLFARCKPSGKWSPFEGYQYDRERVHRLDRLRHDVIHGDAANLGLPDLEEEIDYLFFTNIFLLGMVNLRYKIGEFVANMLSLFRSVRPT